MKTTLFFLAVAVLAPRPAGAAPTRTIAVPTTTATTTAPLRIECPVNQPTRIVISLPFRRLVLKPPSAVDDLGVIVEAAKPEGVIRVQPSRHPQQGELQVQLASRALTILIRTTAAGLASEVRLAVADSAPAEPSPAGHRAAPSPAPRPNEPRATATPVPPVSPIPTRATPMSSAPTTPTPRSSEPPRPIVAPATATLAPSTPVPTRATPTPVVSVAPTPSLAASPPPSPDAATASKTTVSAAPTPIATPAASSPMPAAAPEPSKSASAAPAAAGLDLEGLLSAKPIPIGRQEGLPGQKPMLLEDALRGEHNVWFRFTLRGGARHRVAHVVAGRQEVRAFSQKAGGADLQIVVQLPREQVTKKLSLTIEIADGPKYRFASLTTPTLTNLLNRF